MLVGTVSSVSFINYEQDVNSVDLEFRYCINQIGANDTVLLINFLSKGDCVLKVLSYDVNGTVYFVMVPSIGYVYDYYLNGTEIVVGYNVSLIYDIENELKKGNVWVFDKKGKNSDEMKDFEKWFELDYVCEINPKEVPIPSNYYPHKIYLINRRNDN